MPTVESYQKNKDRRKQAYDYFISKGYSPEASAGIVGNLVHESGLNTTIEGDVGYKGGSSFGIAQFRGERLSRLKKRYGDNWKDFNNQLDFVDWELRNTHKNAGEKLINVSNIHEAGQIFSDLYEIPKKKYHENEARRLAVERVGNDFLTTKQPQPNINSETTDFDENNTFSTFGTQPIAHTKIGAGLPILNDEEETPKEQKNTSKEKEALLQKQKEHQFIQDYLNGSVQREVAQRKQQTQQVPQLDPLQEYNQISSFVENPIMQEGGQIPTSRNGVFDTNGEPVIVPAPSISMKNVDYPIMGISQETGEKKVMMPDMQYFFNNTKNVLEIPMKQQGGEIDKLEYKLPEEALVLDYMIDDFSKEKGGNRELYRDLMDSVAYHESAGTMNPKMKQYGNGPGRGKYMFEGEDGSNRLLTSAKRLKNYFKIKDKPLPNFVSKVIDGKIKDATKLSAKQQDILFLGDVRMGKVDLKDYVEGNITKQDLWADYWWQGSSKDKDKRIAQFNNSLESYNQENS
jgi:hypothetical protein